MVATVIAYPVDYCVQVSWTGSNYEQCELYQTQIIFNGYAQRNTVYAIYFAGFFIFANFAGFLFSRISRVGNLTTRENIYLRSGRMNATCVLLLDREVNHSRKCLEVPIREIYSVYSTLHGHGVEKVAYTLSAELILNPMTGPE